jgi:hypothetical protein
MGKIIEFMYRRKALFRWIFFGMLGAVVLYDFTVPRPQHPHFAGDSFYGFWSIWGLVICLAMIIFWKWLAHGFLERDEDYYDN